MSEPPAAPTDPCQDLPLPGGPDPRDPGLGAGPLPLDRPFTRAGAAAAGVDRVALERLLRSGSVRRLLRGVYVSCHAPDDTAVRVAAVRLALPRAGVVVDRTAGWVHGVEARLLSADAAGAVPVDQAPRRRSGRHLLGRDVTGLDGLLVTTPLRTALDLGLRLPPGRALAAMDTLVRGGEVTHTALLAELPRFTGTAGVGQLRVLVAQVDDRARSAAESVLRLHWHTARLPTAVPGLCVDAGPRRVRLALGVERRQFGAVVTGQLASGEVTREDLRALDRSGWRVVVLDDPGLLGTDPELWVHHLEREFHQQLLAQTG
ncbi:MAG: hypothetical protein JWR42_534 [Marmoricola sp.]|nr:hypothetical protein [Marmoricola sp.]